MQNNATSGMINEHFSELIGLIYEATQDPTLWPDLLLKLDQYLHLTEQRRENQPATDASNHGTTIIPSLSPAVTMLDSHFKRAIAINKQLFALHVENESLTAVLNRLPVGVLLLNAEHTIMSMNAQAKAIINHTPAIHIAHGKLSIESAMHHDKLTTLISQVTAEDFVAHDPVQQMLALDSDDQNTSTTIYITPSVNTHPHADTSRVALFFYNSDMAKSIPRFLSGEIYHLTPAESKLLDLITSVCNSLSEAANHLGLSKHTVRSQMKVILEKTGSHSQIEMVKKTLGSPIHIFTQMLEASLTTAPLSKTSISTTNNTVQTIGLHDGRTLEYIEYGDPQGKPVVFLHSLLHTRQMLHPYSHKAQTDGIRIIAPERPGFGSSSPMPELSLSAYAADIQQLCRHLGLDQIDIIGDASGAPYALACAAALPTWIKQVAIISCIPAPEHDTWSGIIPFERMLMQMCKYTPSSLHFNFGNIFIKGMNKNSDAYFAHMHEHLAGTDQAIVATPAMRNIMLQSFANADEAHIKSFIEDYLYRLKPWDFSVSNIQQHVHIWHGKENRIVRLQSAEQLSKAIPHCTTHFLDNQGHYLFISHWDAVLVALQ